MKKRIKIASALILVILTALVAFVPTVQAAVTPPSSPYWDGTVGRWSPSPDSGVIFYEVDLYIDGYYDSSIQPSVNCVDFTSMINAYPGSTFQFSVAAATGYGSSDLSNAVYSPMFTFASFHTMVFHSASKPTCTEKGCKGYYECTDCGKWFWDENGNNEIADHSEAFNDALGHDWGEWKVTKQPTETSEGVYQRVCRNDSNHVETKAIPKLKSEEKTEPKATEKPQTTTKPDDKKKSTTAPATTKPTTATTFPSTTVKATQQGGVVTVPGTTTGIDNGGNSGINPLFWIVGGILLFLLLIVTPATIILIILLTRKKKNKTPVDAPYQAPPVQNQTRNWQPPQQRNPRQNPQQQNRNNDYHDNF